MTDLDFYKQFVDQAGDYRLFLWRIKETGDFMIEDRKRQQLFPVIVASGIVTFLCSIDAAEDLWSMYFKK